MEHTDTSSGYDRIPRYRWTYLRQAAALAAALAVFGGAAIAAGAEELAFRHEPGTLTRILTDVDEEVYVDGVFSHRAEILERAVLEIVAVDAGEARIAASYRTSERALTTRGSWTWGRAEEGEFRRDRRGRVNVPPEATMPVVRNVPVFPEGLVEPGETWTYPATEVHLFDLAGGTAGPYRAETDVSYELKRIRNDGDGPVAEIALRYDLFHPVDDPASPIRRITGTSRQTLLWDIENGHLQGRDEKFRFFLDFVGGRVLEFRGSQTTRVVVTEPLDTAAEKIRLEEDLKNRDIGGASVTVEDEGLLLTLDDIRFLPDSSRLLDSESRKLDALRPLLDRYGDRDIVVTGHTAMAGTPEGRLRLSRERAETVAEYLYPGGRDGAGTLMIRGVGAADPAATNDTPEGMALNRRVTILIAGD